MRYGPYECALIVNYPVSTFLLINTRFTWLQIKMRHGSRAPSHNIRVLQVCLKLFLTWGNPQKLQVCLRLCLTWANPHKWRLLQSLPCSLQFLSAVWTPGRREASLMKRLKREKGEGRWWWCMHHAWSSWVHFACFAHFADFADFCRFLHGRPTVRLAHVLVYLALVLVDLCTSITARQKKTFSPISATRLLFFPFLSPFQCFG